MRRAGLARRRPPPARPHRLDRDRAAAALATPDGQLTPAQRSQLRTLAVSLEFLGHILREQDDPGCLPYYQEALGLHQRIGART